MLSNIIIVSSNQDNAVWVDLALEELWGKIKSEHRKLLNVDLNVDDQEIKESYTDGGKFFIESCGRYCTRLLLSRSQLIQTKSHSPKPQNTSIHHISTSPSQSLCNAMQQTLDKRMRGVGIIYNMRSINFLPILLTQFMQNLAILFQILLQKIK